MTKADLQFTIDQMRKEKMVYGIDSLAVSLIMVLTAVFLPELLYRVVFANPESSLDPNVLNNVAPVAYGIAVAYFVFAMVGNFLRCKKIERLEKDLVSAKK